MKTHLIELALMLLLLKPTVSSAAELSGTAAPPAAGAPASPNQVKKISVADFEKLRTEKANMVLDVRTTKEFAAGHVPGAINVDVNAPDFAKKAEGLDPKKTYLVHCAAGVRSTRACEKLRQMHFEHLYNLEGGLKAWENAGHQVER